MIATRPTELSLVNAQQQFNAALPEMRRAIGYHVSRLPKSSRDEFEVDVLAACWHAWYGLVRRGMSPLAVGVTGIVTNAVRYVLHGRRLGTSKGGRNVMDVFNSKAQDRTGTHLVSIDQPMPTGAGTWQNLLSSRRDFTPADVACFRLDFEQWLATLSHRKRQMAEMLAEGHETGVVARQLGVTPAAVSIARSYLETSWRAFQGEERPAETRSAGRAQTAAPVSVTPRRRREANRNADIMSVTATA